MTEESQEKSLKEKAVKIQGKDYVMVSDRVIYFNEKYPDGSITTDLVSDPTHERVIIKATITPDMSKASRTFTGYAQETIGQGFINKTSALENAETSAVGRALAMMGIGVIDSIASIDEINKAKTSPQNKFTSMPQATRAKGYAPRKIDTTKPSDELEF